VGDNQKPDNIDRIDFRLPLGMGFSVSGRNASKLFWAVGVTAIIIALGWAVANVIGAVNGNTTELSLVDG
jgi:putative Mn2+ efflux pump MntP